MKTTSPTQMRRYTTLHVTLWIAQIMIAGMFIMAGFLKTFKPIAELSLTIAWAKESVVLTRFIGITEILGGLGLILPGALKIAPRLTVWAAVGLTLIMALGSIFHIVRGEILATPTTLVLGLLAAFIVWGRSTKAPIHAPKEFLR